MGIEDELIKIGFIPLSTWGGGLYFRILYEPECTSCEIKWHKLYNAFSIYVTQADYDNFTHVTEMQLPYIKDIESIKMFIKLITNIEL